MAVADRWHTLTSREGRTWFGLIGASIVTGSLGWKFGPIGLLAGGAISACWYALPGFYAITIGHVLVIPLLPEPSLAVLLALEAGFLAVIAAPVVDGPDWPFGLGAVGLSALLLGAIAWLGWQAWDPRWLAALAVTGLVAVSLYGLHRYAVVLLEQQGVEHRV